MKINSTTKVLFCVCLFLFMPVLRSPVRCAPLCPRKCACTPFGDKFKVKCRGIKQVPRRLPLTTTRLDLSTNDLKFIPQDMFKNLSLLKIINLDENRIEDGFYLPRSVTRITMIDNMLSLEALKTVLSYSKRINILNINENPIGPKLTADTFTGLKMMRYLYISSCGLEHIQSGTFRDMKDLTVLKLRFNMLREIGPGVLEGPGYKLSKLDLYMNALVSIADGTFVNFSGVNALFLDRNQLDSVPDFTGLGVVTRLSLKENSIKDISWLGKSNIPSVIALQLSENNIERLPPNIFRKLPVFYSIDLSFNKLQSLPDEAFSSCNKLVELRLNFNSISQINRRTFAGLTNLRTLMMIHNNLTSIPPYAFADTPLNILFLHNNAIKLVDGKAFTGLGNLRSLTLFGNPFALLPVTIFEEMSSNTTLAVTCKNLHRLSPGTYTAPIVCAPSSSFYVVLYESTHSERQSLFRSGFTCTVCNSEKALGFKCWNCSFCVTGTYGDADGNCLDCPAGGFYQSDMGQVSCKNCSTGTYVSEERHPGKTPTDCHACPYGTLSNETAGYRACKCLRGFYRMDRFGPCSECPAHGVKCVNDTAILAPSYFWKWPSEEEKGIYEKFLENIYTLKPPYEKTFSRFQGTLPQPQKCPYPGSCNGGVDSACQDRFKGFLCATCSKNHYFRFNTCLECPRMVNTIISCVVVVLVFIAVFLVVLWGDSKRTDNNRTVADVVMSCCKIVIGFYQVIAGIFSALVHVRWPVILISMGKYLKFAEGNILQFAPLSCIHSKFRADPFLQFALAVGLNILVVLLIFLFLFLRKRHINKMEVSMSEKIMQISRVKKSCYRNIFLFLLLSYPVTSKKIIDILPLPGVCVNVCFSKSDCISLLRADYSIHCFTPRHKIFWKIAAVFAFYPIAFPLMLLLPIYKYRQAETEKEIAFGLRVFFENYKKKYWFWETLEMYRKLLLISLILLFESESHSQIGFTLVTASASGIAYTLFRPIKGKFEDRLQTFVLWIIFFNVCLGSIYGESDGSKNPVENDSIFVNVLFLLLNSSVLVLAAVKGFLHLKSTWRKVSSCPKQCFYLVCHTLFGCSCRQQENAYDNYLLVQDED